VEQFREKLRKAVIRVLDRFDPPAKSNPRAPCPSCYGDVSTNNSKSEVRDELVYFQCDCGHASAWYWNGHGPQLIYGQEPGYDSEMDEDFD